MKIDKKSILALTIEIFTSPVMFTNTIGMYTSDWRLGPLFDVNTNDLCLALLIEALQLRLNFGTIDRPENISDWDFSTIDRGFTT